MALLLFVLLHDMVFVVITICVVTQHGVFVIINVLWMEDV